MIAIAAAQLAAIRAHAERAYPDECCGLLVGVIEGDGQVRIVEAVPGANVADDRRRSFEVDPQLRFDLGRRLRGSDRAMVGHYHSHPDAAADASPRDRARAIETNLVWLIVAVDGGRAGDVRAFRTVGDATGSALTLIAATLCETG